jgi:hypothetical protein
VRHASSLQAVMLLPLCCWLHAGFVHADMTPLAPFIFITGYED